MAEKSNATCSICGKPYYKCISCKDAMKLRPWQVRTCSSSHYQVSQVVRGFSTGLYTKDEAKKKFKNVDLSDLNTYRDNIRSIIEDILTEPETLKVEVLMVEEPIIEVEQVIEVSEESIEEVKPERPVSYKRKNNIEAE